MRRLLEGFRDMGAMEPEARIVENGPIGLMRQDLRGLEVIEALTVRGSERLRKI